MEAVHQALLDRGMESPYDDEGWRERRARWGDRRRPVLTTRVPVGDWFERRDAALLAHATQVDPNGWFFKIPLALQREVWPTEDFELVRSLVDSARSPRTTCSPGSASRSTRHDRTRRQRCHWPRPVRPPSPARSGWW